MRIETVGPDAPREGPLGRVEGALRLLLGLTWVGLCSTVFLLALLVCLPWRATRIRLGNVYGHAAGKGAAWLTGSRFVVEGTPPPGAPPALYVCNHASILDVFVGIWMAPIGTCGVAKKEIVYYPFFGQFYWLAGHLTLDRGNNTRAVAALERLVGFVLRHRLSVYIWPEGTRSADGRLLPFKRGAFYLALDTRLPIVPIVLSGTHRAWPNHTLTLYRTTVTVKFLPPIDTTTWTRETLDVHIAELREVYVRALPEDQRPQ